MGKITVKHYLNKRVKPFVEQYENIERWPIYIQVTHDRKTTQFRSFTNEVMSDAEFDAFLKTGYREDHKIKHPFYKTNLQKELGRVENLLSFYLSGNWKFVNDERTILEILGKDFFKPAKEMLIQFCWSYTYCRPKTEKEAVFKEKLYQCFNQDIDLLQNIKLLKKYYSVDILEKIPNEDYELWHNLKLMINKIDDNMAFIDFIVSDYVELINSIAGIKDKKRFQDDIGTLINDYDFHR